mmetsp:Transcript_147376/g.257604  ORF Transcript_147376/g.257604 Transcript_147376/m.257604 type:complete len:230 (-) Transcript_147376:656-1345(-)
MCRILPPSFHWNLQAPSLAKASSITCVSSENRSPSISHVPSPRAAKRRALLDPDLDPGTVMVQLTGPLAGWTRTEGDRMNSIRGSSTGTGFLMWQLPMASSSTMYFLPPLFFLSTHIFSIKSGMVSLGMWMGKWYASRHRINRPTLAGVSNPKCRASSASLTHPMDTASPCSMPGCINASIACPMLWPKFSSPRRPPSFSSSVTTWALIAAHRRMMVVKVAGSRSATFS